MTGPCGWAISTGDACGCGSKCWTKHSPTTRDRAETLATFFMWAATGRRYGPCEITVMPCNPAPAEPLYLTYGPAPASGGTGAGPYPILVDGGWHNRGCGGGCTCAADCEVDLPGPVASIVEVLVDGEPVDPDVYRVDDGHLLVRFDGTCWPSCATFGEIPGFEVTYERGAAIPPAVQYGTDQLACQFAKACEGGDCTLPPRLQSLTRQGVSIEVAADQATSAGGRLRTGIAAVDQIIEADNPNGLASPPTVISPDLPPVRVASWAGGS